MEALDDLLSDTDCEGHIDRASGGAAARGHFSFLALSKGLGARAPPLAPFDEDDGAELDGASDGPEGVWAAGRAEHPPRGASGGGSICSGEGDDGAEEGDIGGSLQGRLGRSLWDVSSLGLTGSQKAEELEDDEVEQPAGFPSQPRRGQSTAGDAPWASFSWGASQRDAAGDACSRGEEAEEECEEEDFEVPVDWRSSLSRFGRQEQARKTSGFASMNRVHIDSQWDVDDDRGDDNSEVGEPSKNDQYEAHSERVASLRQAVTSVQTTTDGGASTPGHSEVNSGTGAGQSLRSTPRSLLSADPGRVLFGDELYGHSALVGKSSDTLRANSFARSPADHTRMDSGNGGPHDNSVDSEDAHSRIDGRCNSSIGYSARPRSRGDENESDIKLDARAARGAGSGAAQLGAKQRASRQSSASSTQGIVNPDEIPIGGTGSYSLGGSASSAAAAGGASPATPVSGAQVVQPDGVGASPASTAAPKSRPFLKKGARMPRSDAPQSGGGPMVTKPIVNPPAKKQLRLQPRASSEPSGDRRAEASPRAGAPPGPQPEDCRAAGWEELRESPRLGRGPSLGAGGRRPAAEPPGGGREEGPAPCAARAGLRGRPSSQESGPAQAQPKAREAGPADEWGDSVAWDCRGLEDDLDVAMDDYMHPTGEVPTSPVVKSYFHASSSSRSPITPTGSRGSASGSQPPPQGSQLGSSTPTYSKLSQAQEASVHASLHGRAPRAPADAAHVDADLPVCGDALRGGFPPEQQEGRRRATLAEDTAKACEREREELKRLQARAAQAERDITRERQKLWQEVDSERRALHAEFDAERAALKKERRRLGQGAERQRQQLAEDREMLEERRKLQERTEQLEDETREKEKRWQRTVDRLQRQIADLTRKNQELQEEVHRANKQAQQAQQQRGPEGPRRSSSTASARGRRSSTPKPLARPGDGTSGGQEAAAAGFLRQVPAKGAAAASAAAASAAAAAAWRSFGAARPKSASGSADVSGASCPGSASAPPGPRLPKSGSDAYLTGAGGLVDSDQGLEASSVASTRHDERDCHDERDDASAAGFASGAKEKAEAPPAQEVREVRNLEGRTERIFVDGRREVEFANGLRKVMWPDGHSSVMFQNGDRKEIHLDGMVMYHYAATGAVQTTLPDGSDLFHFGDGQFEKHAPDGTKEIRFPNGTTKRVFADGTEEVSFVDGTVRRTPAAARPAAH